MRLRGKRAVVTGSSRGIGRAVALGLAAEGARVVVNGRDPAAAEAVAEEIRAAGGEARVHAGSVADEDVARALVETCEAAFGGVDVLVNCAGVAEPEGVGVLDLPSAAWREVLGVHLDGTFHACRHAARRMVAQGAGAIVNTGSHAVRGVYGGSAYPAAKGATLALTRALAAELADRGVRVNAVCPGARTRLSTGAAYEARVRALHARGLLGDLERDASLDPPDPRFVAPLYAFLASDLAAGISGRVFSAAGGYVGLFVGPSERPVAFRDPRGDGAWSVEALARAVARSDVL